MNMTFYRVLPLAIVALLPACKSVEVPKVPGVTPYRMVIQQGNFLSQEMVAQLKPGMTKEQVRFILGTPLVTDIFHADRWDYVYFRELANGKREQRNLSVVFEKDKLARVLGDLLPSENAPAQSTGFDPQVKPEATKPAAKPAAEAPKPAAAEPAKPVAQGPAKPAETGQNWGTASDQPEKKPEPQPVAKEEEKKAEEGEPKERGFFGRMLEKIGL
jgi:outer membrane protein assembly factor BamE